MRQKVSAPCSQPENERRWNSSNGLRRSLKSWLRSMTAGFWGEDSKRSLQGTRVRNIGKEIFAARDVTSFGSFGSSGTKRSTEKPSKYPTREAEHPPFVFLGGAAARASARPHNSDSRILPNGGIRAVMCVRPLSKKNETFLDRAWRISRLSFIVHRLDY
jgi:hypothetical protein